MEAILNKYIEDYIEKTKNDKDKEVAKHLKEIIPKTTHLDERFFRGILSELKKSMDSGEDFKNAFFKVCKKYILTGDIINAALPSILTRIVLNELNFLKGIAKNRGIAAGSDEPIEAIIKREDIIWAVNSEDRKQIEDTLGDSKLHIQDVVFVTFDEYAPEADPFEQSSVNEIINRLALDKSVFKESELPTAVNIRYLNRPDVLKKFPIFADSGWFDKFHPPGKNDKYGKTKPLDKSIEGMPEVVHKNLKLADVIQEIRFLED